VAAPDKKVERAYKANCASCHGNDGKAATAKGAEMKIADLTLAAWQTSVSDDEIRTAIAKGVNVQKDGVKKEMDGYEAKLAADQLSALVSYVRFLGAPK
jgi:mono/diheme cytochrome c family protein